MAGECIEKLSSENTNPRLIANFKQPERKLLSAFMAILDIVPEYRGAFLKRCGYRSGLTCQYQSYMEPQYKSDKLPDVRPDGLVHCSRGSQTWSAYIEAKADKGIRADQIQAYAELAKLLDVPTIVTISNEFALQPSELPYHLGVRQRKGREIYHFSWAELRTFTEMFLDESVECNATEVAVLEQLLEFLWDEKSAVQTYDQMPQEWPNFVESAATQLGFTTKTPGITEIVHGWQQERRDLAAKILKATKRSVELRHEAGVRADAEQRLKFDRRSLADDYTLTSNYFFKASQANLKVQADLRSCQIASSLEFNPPPGKKALATTRWIANALSNIPHNGLKISFDWKGRRAVSTLPVEEFSLDPDSHAEGQSSAPKRIRIILESHNVRRFKSRKNFIIDVEALALQLANLGSSIGQI